MYQTYVCYTPLKEVILWIPIDVDAAVISSSITLSTRTENCFGFAAVNAYLIVQRPDAPMPKSATIFSKAAPILHGLQQRPILPKSYYNTSYLFPCSPNSKTNPYKITTPIPRNWGCFYMMRRVIAVPVSYGFGHFFRGKTSV